MDNVIGKSPKIPMLEIFPFQSKHSNSNIGRVQNAIFGMCRIKQPSWVQYHSIN